MIDIITSGCSFTHDLDSWAECLKKHYQNDSVSVTNVAQGGVGQEHIVRSSLVALQKSKNKKICIVQFSGFTRMEVIIDEKERPEFHDAMKLDNKYSKIEFDTGLKFGGLVEGRKWNNHYTDSIILMRTADMENGDLTWYQKKSTAGEMIGRYDKIFGIDQRQMLTYEHIASLQWYCKLNDIPLFCFWGWEEANVVEDSFNKEVVKASYDLVDWNNFWFYGNNGGMAEWMMAHGHHGNLSEDNINDPPRGWKVDPYTGENRMIGHPTPQAHKDFCDQIIIPWVEERLPND